MGKKRGRVGKGARIKRERKEEKRQKEGKGDEREEDGVRNWRGN